MAGDAMASQAAPQLVLVLGGARSGKSAYGETLARQLAGEKTPVLYIATATASDDEMRQRITQHQANRPSHWFTVEEPWDPASALRASDAPVALLDCVTLLVANLLLADIASDDAWDEAGAASAAAEARVDHSINDLLDTWRTGTSTLILISNEVGMGVVPPYPLGRVYRDCLGRINARLAQEAHVVLLMVAGLPIELKTLSAAWHHAAADRFGPRG